MLKFKLFVKYIYKERKESYNLKHRDLLKKYDNNKGNKHTHIYTMANSDLEDLRDVLKDTLENRGVLGQVKARIRAEIFAALDDNSLPPPKLSNENLIINELIREYLEYNNYRQSLSVFLPETGQPQEAAQELKRSFLAKQLQVNENSNSERVPLLYGLLSKYQKNATQQAAQAVINQQLNSSTKFTETKNSTTPGNTSIGTNKALPMNENVLSTNENILASGSQPNPFEFSNQ